MIVIESKEGNLGPGRVKHPLVLPCDTSISLCVTSNPAEGIRCRWLVERLGFNFLARPGDNCRTVRVVTIPAGHYSGNPFSQGGYLGYPNGYYSPTRISIEIFAVPESTFFVWYSSNEGEERNPP
jgi:hypothetical protein